MLSRKDITYKHLISYSGTNGLINNIPNRFLITENDDSDENGYDLKNIITDVQIKLGDYVTIDNSIYMIIDIKKVNDSSYTIGTYRKINHINKFVDLTDNVVYSVPSICKNVTKEKLNILVQTAGITEASGVWSFIAPYNDITKKITIGKRFIINGQAWKTTSLDFTTEEGILTVIMKVDSISTEYDDIINEVADGKKIITHTYDITFNETDLNLYPNETKQLNPVCNIDGVAQSNPNVIYSSSDETIAMVNSSGVIKGISEGNCVITATFKGINATIDINVAHIYSITINNEQSIILGNTLQLDVTCKEDNVIVNNKIVTYSSSNELVAKIDSNGLITSVGTGDCNIIATYEGVSDTFNLTVNEKPHVYTIALNSTTQSIATGSTFQIVPACTDNSINVSSPIVSYVSSDTSIATVSTTGLITAIASGSAVITANYQGQSATLSLTVTHQAVTTYSYTLSNDLAILMYEANTFTCLKQNDGVTDPTLKIAYTLDTVGTSLLSRKKIGVTSTNSSVRIENLQKETDTAQTLHLTIKDSANGSLIVDNIAVTIKNKMY